MIDAPVQQCLPQGAVGAFYVDFRQVADEEVIADLARAAAGHAEGTRHAGTATPGG